MALFSKGRASPEDEAKEFLADGEVFGEYTILKMISYSLIGCLYLAEQRVSQKRVCLMVLPSRSFSDPRFSERFRRLVERLGELKHPNLLPLQNGTIMQKRFVLVYDAVPEEAITLDQYPEAFHAGLIKSSEHPFTLEGQQEKDAKEAGRPGDGKGTPAGRLVKPQEKPPEKPPEKKVPEARSVAELELKGAAARKSRLPFGLGSRAPLGDGKGGPRRTRNPLGAALQRLRPQGVPYEKAAPILRQVLEAAKYIHGEGMDHLSLTPSTILYLPDGSTRVFNVGLTHTFDKELFERIVSAGISPIQAGGGGRKNRLITIDMFSPEMRAGQPYRANSDIYGIGVLCYWFLSGRKPVMGKYQSPRDTVPDLPGNWDLFLYKSLDTNPKTRHPTIASQIAEFIRINQPERRESTHVLAAQLERIPVPASLKKRGERVTLVYRLAILGLVGMVVVGGLAAVIPGILPKGEEGKRPKAFKTEPGGTPGVEFVFQPQRVMLEFLDGVDRFIVLDGRLDLNVKKGRYRLRVVSPNHYDQVLDLDFRGVPLGRQPVTLRPQWAFLRARGKPGTTILAESPGKGVIQVGVIPETGELQITEGVYSGQYRVWGELPNHGPRVMEEVVFSPGQEMLLDLTVEPLPAVVEVDSRPQGAEVLIGGKPVGVTPLRLEGVEVEQDLVFSIRREGFRERTQTLHLQPNANVLLNFGNLIRRTGEIRPKVTLKGLAPAEEELRSMTFRVGEVDFGGDLAVLAPVQEGDHILRVEHPDYHPQEIPLRVADGKFTPVAVDLQPRPGQLTVRLSPPQEFRLVANGAAQVPLDAAESTFALEPGKNYEVEVQIRDYLTSRRSLAFAPNERVTWEIQPVRIPGPKEGEGYLVPYAGIPLQYIPAGTFLMGSPPEEPSRLPSEGPQTAVRISRPFWVGRHEVTQRQFMYLMDRNPSNFREETHPVDSVSWQDAVAFCRRLNDVETQAGRVPAGYEYRLPTEAEWEYAARAGVATPFIWGGAADPSLGNFKGVYPRDFNEAQEPSSVYGSLPVGSYQANAWGLFDVHGNVREWIGDYWNARLPGGEVVDYAGPPGGSQRVFRGGGWEDSAHRVRLSERNGSAPGTVSSSMGFRMVLGPRLGVRP